MAHTFFWLFWPDICVPSQISGPVELLQKLDGKSNQRSLKMYAQNLIFRHCRKEQLYSNANLLGNYFLIRIQKVLSFEKSKLLHFLHKLVGMNPNSTHMFRWAWIFRKKREKEKEKDHTFTRASTW